MGSSMSCYTKCEVWLYQTAKRKKNIKPERLRDLTTIKGFIKTDNNYFDHEWRMLICA